MSDAGGQGSGRGTVYLSGDKYRTDMTVSPSGGQAIESHIISDGTWLYQWNSMGLAGTKMKIEDIEKMSQDGQALSEDVYEGQYSQKTLDQEFAYDCSSWSVDQGLFTPPGDVDFQDISVMLQKTQKMGENLMDNLCAMCDSLPEATQQDCLRSCSQQ